MRTGIRARLEVAANNNRKIPVRDQRAVAVPTIFESSPKLVMSLYKMLYKMKGYQTSKPNQQNIRNNQGVPDSLYQACRRLKRRLKCVPGFGPYMDAITQEETDNFDSVSSLRNSFCNGHSLLAIYNALQPDEGNLVVERNSSDNKNTKAAVYMFVRACMLHLRIPASELFTLDDMYGSNMTAFSRIVKVVNRVVDMLEMKGLLISVPVEDSLAQVKGEMQKRDYILKEFVESETQYVNDLYDLCQLQKEIEYEGALTADSLHEIFLNLRDLSEFAHRFLVRVEQHCELSEDVQDWGDMFIHYKECFRVYEIFVSNQRRRDETCEREGGKLVSKIRTPLGQQILANPVILRELLLQPRQRLPKYPIFLAELMKETYSEEIQVSLATAVEMLEDQLKLVEASIEYETTNEAVRDLGKSVVDWRSLEPHLFGKIVLYETLIFSSESIGVCPLQTFLFSQLMIMCKEKNNAALSSRGAGSMARPAETTTAAINTRLHLKGHIYMSDITDVLESSVLTRHQLLIFWKGSEHAKSFTMTFRSRDTMHRWHEAIKTHRAASLAVINNAKPPSGVASTPLEQSYVEDDDEEQKSPVVQRISRLFISQEPCRDSTSTMSSIDAPPPPYFLANRPDSLVEMYTRHLF